MAGSTGLSRAGVLGVLACMLNLFAAGTGWTAVEQDEPGWAQVQVDRVDGYLATLPLPGVDDPDAILVHDTMQSLGTLATSLVLRGQRGGEESASALVAGSMLADGLPAIRESLEKLHSDSVPLAARAAAREELKRFEREYRLRLASLVNPAPASLDATLQELFSPLRTAIRHLDQAPPPAGWWSAPDLPESRQDPRAELAVMIVAADWLSDRQQTRALEQLDVSPDRAWNDVLLRVARAIDDIGKVRESRIFAKKLPPIFMKSIGAEEIERPDRGALLELARGLERRVAFNEHEAEGLPRELLVINVRLGELYVRAERKLIEQVDLILASRSPRSDPELVAIITNQHNALDAVQLLAAMPMQIEFFLRIDPVAAKSIQQQVTKMVRQLDDLQRSDDAMRALRSLAWQVHIFDVLPLEQELLDGNPELDAMLAHRSATVLERINKARVAWARDWGRGDALGSGARELARLNRLMEHARVAMDLETKADPGTRLEPWAAWSMPDDRIEQWQRDMRDRLRVAATAIAEEDVEQADDQLDQLEMDLAVLRLAHLLIETGPGSPGGTGAGLVLGQLAMPPEHDAWLLEHRDTLASISRLAMESQAARIDGRMEEADALHRDLARRAHALWLLLSGPTTSPRRIPGFDGTDPDPELSTYRLKYNRRR